jgi:hypothetical protein
MCDPGQPEVAKLGIEFIIEEYVGWFDISVQDIWVAVVVEITKSGP